MLLLRIVLVLAVVTALLSAECAAASESDRNATVILASLDGFRYDYASLYGAQRLKEIAARGTVADGLIPVFPSMTFSSHYSIVTGMYPEHHGVVDNTFYDPALGKLYNFSRDAADAVWYRGTSLWALAEKQGVRTAVMAWPGG